MATFRIRLPLMTCCNKPLLDQPILARLTGSAFSRLQLVHIGECESTNSLLLDLAEKGAQSGTLVVTDRQTAGRGSRGRQWVSTPTGSLTFSLLWRFSGGLEKLSGLSLATGIAVVEALDHVGAKNVTLKWPNDILYEDQKLGGILIELHADAQGAMAVIGIGINLETPPAIPQYATSLQPSGLDVIIGAPIDRHTVLAALLAKLVEVFDQFDQTGFAGLKERWEKYNAWQNRPVALLRDGKVETQGVCRGADEEGLLLIETDQGIEHCISGDLSLRALC